MAQKNESTRQQRRIKDYTRLAQMAHERIAVVFSFNNKDYSVTFNPGSLYATEDGCYLYGMCFVENRIKLVRLSISRNTARPKQILELLGAHDAVEARYTKFFKSGRQEYSRRDFYIKESLGLEAFMPAA